MTGISSAPQSGKHIIFARHPISHANVIRQIANRGNGPPLVEEGVLSAYDLAKELGVLPISKIHSSPLLRAVQASEIIGSVLKVEVEIEEALREYDLGDDLEGRSDDEAWRRYRALSKAWIQEGNVDLCETGGESLVDIRSRFSSFVTTLVARDEEGIPLVMSHAGLYRCGFPVVFSNMSDTLMAERKDLGHGEVVVARHRGALPLTCVSWGAPEFPRLENGHRDIG